MTEKNTKYPIEVHIAPTLLSGPKKYAVSGNNWIEVSQDTTYEDLPKYFKVVPYGDKSLLGSYTIKSKSSNSSYTVEKRNEFGLIVYSCTCPAGKYRGKCKHIEAVKKR